MRSAVTSLLLALLILLATISHASASPLADKPIDLSSLSETVNLVDFMQVRQAKIAAESDGQPKQFSELLSAHDWLNGQAAQRLITAPRERSAIWLHVPITNASDELLSRWLDVSPWRLNRVNAWYLDPDTLIPISDAVTGSEIPVAQRTVDSSRALLPVQLMPGETQQVLIKVFSESRPFLDIHSWSPVGYTAQKVLRYQFHTFLFAVVLTLVAVISLQRTRLYLLMAAWMLVTFIFEAEKEGYISYVLVDGLAPYALNMRTSSWILSEALFLITTVYLSGIRRVRPFCWFPAIALSVSAVFSIQTFFLDGSEARVLASLIHFCFSIAWLTIIPSALKQQRKWKFSMLTLLSVWWVSSNFLLAGYFFNFYYTAQFTSIKVLTAAVSILGVMYVYSIQKRQKEKDLEERLRRQEKRQRQVLERTVISRTRELRQAVEKADQANAAKSDFLARVSHDLKSPLTSILGYSQLLFSEEGRAGEMSRTIYSSASHLLNLVDRLIGYARGAGASEAQVKDIYLHYFINSVANEAKFIVKTNNNVFNITKSEGLPGIICSDEGYLRQILLNLLDNSAKHTHNGKIDLDVRVEPTDSQIADVVLIFCMRDTGTGIPEQYLHDLWDAFYQAPGQHAGLGLGLSIVKNLTQQLNGEVSLESTLGEGTRVCVALPVRIGSETALDTLFTHLPQYVLPSFDASGLSAMVVEDSASIRNFLTAELAGQGFNTSAFESVEAFANALAAGLPRPDLVLTDYLLPDGTGSEVLERVKEKWAAVPVILLSAIQPVVDVTQEGGVHSFSAVLSKPVDLAKLRYEFAFACDLPLQAPGSAQLFSDAVSETPPSLPYELSLDERSELASFVAMGAASDLKLWSERLIKSDTSRASLGKALRCLVEQGRIDEIGRLIDTEQPS